MPAYFAKQPNGLFLRYSSIVDCPTMINMSEDDVRKILNSDSFLSDKMIDEIINNPCSMNRVIQDFYPANMSRKDFDILLREVEKPIDKDTKMEYT